MFSVVIAAGGEEAPNGWLLPHDINEVIWGSTAFFIIAALMWWKAIPAAREALAKRSQRIADELAAAESARTEAEAALAELQARIADAEGERQRILAEAKQQAEALESQLVAKATQDAADLRARGAHDAESAKHQAIADLRAEVGDLALGAAEAIIAQNLDDATQQALIDSYIEQVGR